MYQFYFLFETKFLVVNYKMSLLNWHQFFTKINYMFEIKFVCYLEWYSFGSHSCSVGSVSPLSHAGEAAAHLILDSSPTSVCLKECGSKWLGCHAGYQEVSRCHTRGESEEPIVKHVRERFHPGFETQRRYHQNWWPHEKNWCPPNIFSKKVL